MYIKTLSYKFNVNDLRNSMEHILSENKPHPFHGQLCFTNTKTPPQELPLLYEGCGSLMWEGGAQPLDNNEKLIPRKISVKEEDFTEFNPNYRESYFYSVFQEISREYQIGRMRLMIIPPKRCLSWHVDPEERIHVPIITDESCKIVIEDRAYHLPANGGAYLCNVTVPHTAFNGHYKNKRYNLLFNVIGYKDGAQTLLG